MRSWILARLEVSAALYSILLYAVMVAPYYRYINWEELMQLLPPLPPPAFCHPSSRY